MEDGIIMSVILRSNHIFDTETKTTYPGFIQINNGMIESIGKLSEIPGNMTILDYSQQMIIPGFIDAHVHFYLSALIHSGCLTHLTGVTEAEFVAGVKDVPTTNGWKIGIGWFSSDFGQNVYPSKHSLDVDYKDVPVLLISGDAHSIWLNSKGLAELGITSNNIPTDLSGEAMVDESGELTGCFLEAIAINYLSQVLESFKEKSNDYYLDYMKYLNKMGITSVGDVALTGECEDDLVYPELYEAVEDEATVRTSFYPAMREDISKLRETYATYNSDKLQMGGVKQFFDGVTSIHTAFLKEEYETPYFEGDVGSPLIPSETMREFILKANAEGWPIRIHTIGDRAIHEALTYYKESLAKFPLPQGKYNTLEHLEVMDSQDLPLVSQEQLVISVQPSHLLVGYDTLDEEVGSVRAAEMFPFNSFLKVGGILAFGTDTPVVVDVTPIESLYYAVARREKSGVPSERLMPKEVISIGEALYAHTKGAAKALSRDDIGTIAVGKKADFTILSKNLLEVTEEEILETEVVATIFNGEVM